MDSKSTQTWTRADFLALLEQVVGTYYDAGRRPGPIWLAHMEGLLYRQTGERTYGEHVKEALLLTQEAGIGYHGNSMYPAGAAYGSIQESDMLNQKESGVIEEVFLRRGNECAGWKWGDQWPSMNIPMGFAMACRKFAQLLPHRAESSAWTAFSEEMLEKWLLVSDVPEDASNYEPITMFYTVKLAELLDKEEALFQNPLMRLAGARYVDLICPVGVLPDYGDSEWGVEWGLWVALFEKFSGVYQDGRFKWASRELLRRSLAEGHGKDADGIASHGVNFGLLVDAYLWSDDEVAPEKPKEGSAILYRALADASFSPVQGQLFDIKLGPRLEDKLVLRGGWEEDSAYLALNLMKPIGHDHMDAGAIVTFVAEGSVLLHDTGYIQKAPEYHNLFYVQDLQEEFLRPSWPHHPDRHDYKPSMTYFCDLSRVSLAVLRSPFYFGYPINHTRTLVFDKAGRMVAVHDAGEVYAGEYELGPIYHVEKIVEKQPNFFDTQLEAIQSVQPAWGTIRPNKPRKLLVAFPLSVGEVRKKTLDSSPHSYRYAGYTRGLADAFYDNFDQRECIYQSAKVTGPDQVSFLSLLIPYPVENPASAVMERMELLFNEEGTCAVGLRQDGGRLVLGFKGQSDLETRDVATDARVLSLEEGKEVYIAFLDASRMRYGEQEVFHTLEPEKTDDISRFVQVPPLLSGEITLREDRVEGMFQIGGERGPTLRGPTVEVSLGVKSKPKEVAVDGKPTEIAYDAKRKRCTLAVPGKIHFNIVLASS